MAGFRENGNRLVISIMRDVPETGRFREQRMSRKALRDSQKIM